MLRREELGDWWKIKEEEVDFIVPSVLIGSSVVLKLKAHVCSSLKKKTPHLLIPEGRHQTSGYLAEERQHLRRPHLPEDPPVSRCPELV